MIENFLKDEEHAKLEKHCKGCQFFIRGVKKTDICNIISWTENTNLKEIVNYAKGCPCVKCLVKAACTETLCQEWRDYVSELLDEREEDYLL